MTNLKDKLSASVRQAKAKTAPATSAPPLTRPVARSTKGSAAPAPRPAKAAEKAATTTAGFGFPNRVWPD